MPTVPADPHCPKCGLRTTHDRYPCLYDRLRAALGDLEPTPVEDRILHWLAGVDQPTVEPIATLFERLRAAQR